MHKGVFCGTSFFIRLLDKSDPLHENAKGYFKYFTENDFVLMISTIAIAEYCVGGDVHELPLRNLQIVPFNFNHAKRTGEFAKLVFQAKRNGEINFKSRNIIPNDSKLFAQADCETSIKFYLSSDTDSKNIYKLLNQEMNLKFEFIDVNIPFNETFGLIDFENS